MQSIEQLTLNDEEVSASRAHTRLMAFVGRDFLHRLRCSFRHHLQDVVGVLKVFHVHMTEGQRSRPAAKQQMNGDVIIDKLSVINLPLCLAKNLLELKLGTEG